jgi:hypothetical protein
VKGATVNDYFDYDENGRGGGFASSLPGPLRAALFVSLVLLVLNVITFMTAGTSAALSLPLLGLVYLACGALSARFNAQGNEGRAPVIAGAMAGGALWIISFVANILLTLLLGGFSLGVGFLIGIPYLCLCSPVELLLGAILGSFGGFVYGLFDGRTGSSDPDW